MDDKVEFQLHNYGTVSKRDCNTYSPERGPRRLTFTGNFTPSAKLFDITAAARRASMRQDILNTVLKRTESRMLYDNMCSINPIYEDPQDVIGDKPPKPPRKRTIQGVAVTSSPKSNKDTKLTLKEQRKKLTKKYEGLITTLLEKCEENVVLISERDSHITKLKDKLKTVLEYNKLFAEENDQLKHQYSELVKYIDECKTVIREERERSKELEEKNGELKEKVEQFMVPDKDAPEQPTTVPLVEVCMSCSSRQILLNQAKEQNSRLHKDMQALKDLLYRLNVQLSRYQEKLRTSIHAEHARRPGRAGGDGLDSLIATSMGIQGHDGVTTEHGDRSEQPPAASSRVADLSGLLSTQALAPLFDAYQEHLQEKDNLILDYEKQFENINKKSKQVVDENKTLSERVAALEEEVTRARQSYKKLMVEKEMGDIEKATLQERVEKAETKLKEVYELYEDKMAAMMRDYETVHREYFTVRSALEASAGKVAALDAMRARTVPADLHERRLDDCKRLLEELKHQYGMETERKTEQLAKLQQQLNSLEDKHNKLVEAHKVSKTELDTALKNIVSQSGGDIPRAVAGGGGAGAAGPARSPPRARRTPRTRAPRRPAARRAHQTGDNPERDQGSEGARAQLARGVGTARGAAGAASCARARGAAPRTGARVARAAPQGGHHPQPHRQSGRRRGSQTESDQRPPASGHRVRLVARPVGGSSLGRQRGRGRRAAAALQAGARRRRVLPRQSEVN